MSLPTAHASMAAASTDAVRGLRREHMYSRFSRTQVTKEMVMQWCEEYGVQFVDMQFVDILGNLKAKTIPVHKLEESIEHGTWFDGSSVKGFAKITETDMILRPDLNSFAVLPWTRYGDDVTARLVCDVYNSDNTPFEGSPRWILKRQIEEATKLGLKFMCGPELEFFLFKKDENGVLTTETHDEAGYFDQEGDKALQLRRLMSFALDEMGIEIEALHHEVARGQHEINFRYDDALRTADNMMSFKFTLKSIASQFGLHASFMPKPFFGINGSGMHVHQSLADIETGVNRFYDAEGTYHLSGLAQSFIAGQMLHIKALNAIVNPTVNSYKRLVVGYEAPVNVAWAQRNRSALIRVPRLSPGTESKAVRCEVRCPDPSANPYLALAGLLASGLDGIKKGMVPPAPVEANIWRLSKEEMQERGVTTVAGSLKEALDALAQDEVLIGMLGSDAYAKYHAIKTAEWDAYRMSVSEWEREQYMDL